MLGRSNNNIAVLSVVFSLANGSIGFDLAPLGNDLFNTIIGDAKSWDLKANSPIRLKGNNPFEFIKKYIGWLPQPITVTTVTNFTDDQSKLEWDTLSVLPDLMNGDPDTENFGSSLGHFFSSVNRLCIHSVGQWQTIVITRDPGTLLEILENKCCAGGIEYRVVDNEAALPAW
jgi:hypothetical protein